MKRIIGIIILVAGLAMIGISMYINNQVAQGKLQISEAQGKVNQGNSLFGLNPVTKQVGKGITGSAQKKINAGQEEVSYYEQMASSLQIGGIVAIVLGALIIFIPMRKRH